MGRVPRSTARRVPVLMYVFKMVTLTELSGSMPSLLGKRQSPGRRPKRQEGEIKSGQSRRLRARRVTRRGRRTPWTVTWLMYTLRLLWMCKCQSDAFRTW